MEEFECELLIHDQLYMAKVNALDETDAAKQVEKCLSVFNKVNIRGDIYFDTEYFEALLEQRKIPRKYKGVNISFSKASLEEILSLTREKEIRLNEYKKSFYESKRIRLVDKNNNKNIITTLVYFFFRFMTFPMIYAVKSLKDFVTVVKDAFLMLKQINQEKKKVKSKISKSLEINRSVNKVPKVKHIILFSGLISFNLFLYMNLNIYLYLPLLTLMVVYLLAMIKISRG